MLGAMKNTLILTLLIALASAPSLAKHDLFTRVLKDHVKNGRVDYPAIKKDGRFAKYLKQVSKVDASRLNGDGAKAYWINVYNAFTIKVINDHWPVKSIRDIENGKVWDKEQIVLNGQKYTLNQIEHQILRPLGDARVHFALVCAARSCPPLRNEAYEAPTLNAQLDDQGRTFLRNTELNKFNTGARTASLSKIFEWFKADFAKSDPALLKALTPFLPTKAAKDVKGHAKAWKITYLKYDWALNKK